MSFLARGRTVCGTAALPEPCRTSRVVTRAHSDAFDGGSRGDTPPWLSDTSRPDPSRRTSAAQFFWFLVYHPSRPRRNKRTSAEEKKKIPRTPHQPPGDGCTASFPPFWQAVMAVTACWSSAAAERSPLSTRRARGGGLEASGPAEPKQCSRYSSCRGHACVAKFSAEDVAVFRARHTSRLTSSHSRMQPNFRHVG